MGRGGKRGGRGGGRKMFIANVEELEMRNQQFADQAEARKARRADSDDDDDDDDDDEEGGEEGGKEGGAAVDTVFKVAAGVGAGDGNKGGGMAAAMGRTKNPNQNNDPKVAPKMMKLKDLKSMGDALPAADPDAGMTRKQREAMEAERKAEDYLRRRMAGETAEAKRDLERLKEIRARREAQKQQREAEGRAPGWTEEVESDDGSDSDDSDDDDSDDSDGGKAGKAKLKSKSSGRGKKGEEQPVSLGAMSKELAEAKKKAAAAPAEEEGESSDLPLLKAMDIKKMNPNELKDHLKTRNLSIQGAKKDLAKRLQDYETERAAK